MWFSRKNSDPRAKQIVPKGQKKKTLRSHKLPLLKFFLKIAICALPLGGLFFGLYFYGSTIKHYMVVLEHKISRQFLERIEFHSNGVLTPQWVKSFLPHFDKGTHMLDIDIFAIKQSIETCSQIKSVRVERLFPGVLKIVLEERVPILRLSVQEGKNYREMMVDVEGIVFCGEGFSGRERYAMPFLKGVTLEKIKDGYYQKIPNLEKVYPLLHLARTKYWPIFAQMEVVSIEHLNSKNVPWSRIEVRCQFAPSVIFKDHDFDEQLKRLDFILSVPNVHNRLPLDRIDLTLGKEAAVKFRK